MSKKAIKKSSSTAKASTRRAPKTPPPELKDDVTLQLSTRIFVTPSLQGFCKLPIVPRRAQTGDIKVMCRLDGFGLSALMGRHCNAGYSGNICAAVFDGAFWRALNLHSIAAANLLGYGKQYEKNWKVPYFLKVLDALKSGRVTARGGVFEFEGDFGQSKFEQEVWVEVQLYCIEINLRPARAPRNRMTREEQIKTAGELLKSGKSIAATVIKTNPQLVYLKVGDREMAATLIDLQSVSKDYPVLKFDETIQVRVLSFSFYDGEVKVTVVRESEDLPAAVMQWFEVRGGKAVGYVVNTMKGEAGKGDTSPGVIIRVGYLFNAALYRGGVAGRWRREREQRFSTFKPGTTLEVELVCVTDKDGHLRIRVREAQVEYSDSL